MSVSGMCGRRSFRALVALLLALALLAAACGGSDDDAADAAGDDTAGQDDNASDAPNDEGDDDGDTEPADEPEPEPEPADEPVAPSGAAALFCVRYAENQALSDTVNFVDPDALESWLNTSKGLLAEAIADAPGELAADLQLTFDSFAQFQTILEAYDDDFFAAADEIEELTTTPELEAAEERIDAWIEANCPDVDDGDDAAAGDDVSVDDAFADAAMFEAILASEAGRALLAEELAADGEITVDQANCFLDGLADSGGVAAFVGLATGAAEPEAVVDLIELFAACGIDINAFG